MLLPSMVGILTVSRVVSCSRRDDGDVHMPWQIAVSYEHLRESDRELLVRHVMNKETRQVRANRNNDD